MKKKSKIIIIGSLALSLIIALFAFGATVSYLTDYERKDNVVTIGDVKIEIDEGKYEDSSTVAAGSTLPKAPRIKNKGINDAYVFFRVAIPKKSVTLLYEQNVYDNNSILTYKEGTKYDGFPDATNGSEIFKTIAEGTGSTVPASVDNTKMSGETGGESLTAPSVIVGYNKGTYDNSNNANSKAGWVYLGSEQNQEISGDTSGDTSGQKYDFYWFGYNKKLVPTPSDAAANAVPPQNYWTTTLFDNIQLKSFIDEELIATGEQRRNVDVKVLVDAYGIQADNIDITLNDGILTDDQVKSIFDIVQRKRGVS